MSTHKPIFTLDQVGICYKVGPKQNRDYWALKNITFKLHKGECLGIIGDNGAGKSTLLRVMAGILAPDHGKIESSEARPSLLTLQLGFNPLLTGRENAIFMGVLLGLTRKQIEQRLPDIIRFSELGDFIDNHVGTYSSGMRARLGFSVAIQSDPDVLLIDEILGVGDASFRKRSSDFMREWIRSDKTVVFVSHASDTVRDLCDRVIWLENGRIALDGEPNYVLQKYQRYVEVVKCMAHQMQLTDGELRTEIDTHPLLLLERLENELKGIALKGEIQKNPKKVAASDARNQQ